MSEKPMNPLAFPFATADGYVCEGMTLRDYFAAAALPFYISSKPHLHSLNAEMAYAQADAMLKAREASHD